MDRMQVDPVAWLLRADVAVQFQARRDLLDEERLDLQARVATEGEGSALLAAQGPDGHWGRGFYQPKWTSSHYTLLELRDLCLPRDHPAARVTVDRILAESVGPDGGLNPSPSSKASDACINAMALGYCAWFGAESADLRSVVDFLLGQQLTDGGLNCLLNRNGARHSSVHTTVCTIEGVTTYLACGYDCRAVELASVRAGCVEFLLRHRLFRSERTGEVIHPELLRLHHPPRWHYDVLRGLDALAAAGIEYDERMADAIGVLLERRRADGLWSARRYPGETHLPAPPARSPSPWATLKALRVLRRYGAGGRSSDPSPLTV